MKQSYIAILMLGSFFLGYTQVSAQDPITSFDQLFPWGLTFLTEETGIAVGMDYSKERDFIVRTEDAGVTWYSVPHVYTYNGDYSDLIDLHFSDSLNGWTVGHLGIIHHTVDGGVTWDKVESNVVSGNIFSVFSLDNQNVWIGEWGNRICRTTDGFDTWDNYISEIESGPFDLYFFNADTGFTVFGGCEGCTEDGSDKGGYILRTTDGGVSWDVRKQDNDIWGYYQICFLNDTLGYVTGAGGSLLRTEDAGLTWTEQEINTSLDLWKVQFTNEDNGYIAAGNWYGTEGGIFRTTDGGATWTALDIPTTGKGIYFLSFTDENTGWAIGYGILLRTKDAGETWEEWVYTESSDISDSQVAESIMSIYPNPSDGIFTIEIDNRLNQRIKVEVIDLAGKAIFQKSYGNRSSAIVETLELDDRLSGIFLVKVTLDDAVFVQKVVIR